MSLTVDSRRPAFAGLKYPAEGLAETQYIVSLQYSFATVLSNRIFYFYGQNARPKRSIISKIN